ncbi:MAG: hypothetical protein DRH30_04810 [Deltaproteobacteria bacterium]|nr:MAG: hypothetical protein DRH30_04810 [Deltaproteobacteria bacterium]
MGVAISEAPRGYCEVGLGAATPLQVVGPPRLPILVTESRSQGVVKPLQCSDRENAARGHDLLGVAMPL